MCRVSNGRPSQPRGLPASSASATQTRVAAAMSCTLIHSSGPWICCIPVKMFGVGTPAAASPIAAGTSTASVCAAPRRRSSSRSSSDRHAMALYSAEEVLEAAAKGNVVIRNTVNASGSNYLTNSASAFGPIITTSGTITNLNPWANFSY